MKNRTMLVFVAVMLCPLAGANHISGCTPTQAHSAIITEVTALNRTFYVEERCEGGLYGSDGNDHCFRQDPGKDITPAAEGFLPGFPHPPVPGEGFAASNGTWIYRESNGLRDGLQRGGIGMVGPADPITDIDCGHGPDTLVAGFLF